MFILKSVAEASDWSMVHSSYGNPTSFSFLAPLSVLLLKDSHIRCTPWSVLRRGDFEHFVRVLKQRLLKVDAAFIFLNLTQVGHARAITAFYGLSSPTHFYSGEIHTNWDMKAAKPAPCETDQQPPPTLLKNGYPSNNFKFF